MAESKNFLIIWFPLELVESHLNKDVGAIPRIMSDYYCWQPYILTPSACRNTKVSFKLRGVSIFTIRDAIGSISALILLVKASFRQKTNLILYFLNIETLTWIVALSFIFKNFRFHIKCDFNPRHVKQLTDSPKLPLSRLLKVVKRKLVVFALSKVQSIIVEQSYGCHLLQSKFPSLKNKIVYIPNGFHDSESTILQERFPKRFSFKKEKVILCVGRIGLPFKGHMILLDALKNIDPQGWSFLFVGPLHNAFEQCVANFLLDHRRFIGSISLLGEITSRDIMDKLYMMSSILCHPSLETESHVESSALVLVEALRWGNYLITTNAVPSSQDIIANDSYGEIIPSNCRSSLTNALLRAMSLNPSNEMQIHERVSYAKSKYDWQSICSSYNSLMIG